MHYYRHHIGDFNLATRHLTRLERSIYRDMIELIYEIERPLPNDMAWICRRVLAHSKQEKQAVTFCLGEFFTRDSAGLWHQKRCEEEIASMAERADAAAKAGKASAAKASERLKAENGPADSGSEAKQVNPTANEAATSAQRKTNSNSTPVQREGNAGSTDAQRTFNATATDVQRGVNVQATTQYPIPNTQYPIQETHTQRVMPPASVCVSTPPEPPAQAPRPAPALATADPDLAIAEAPPGYQPPQPSPTLAGRICKAMRQEGIPDTNPGNASFLKLIEAGASEIEFVGSAAKAVAAGKGSFAYVLGIVTKTRMQAKALDGQIHHGALPMPFVTVNKQEAIEARNKAVGDAWVAKMLANKGESHEPI